LEDPWFGSAELRAMTSFSVVRNPFMRTLSAYLNKIGKRNSSVGRSFLERFGLRSGITQAELSFSDFLRLAECEPDELLNNHIRPQYLNLLHPFSKPAYIGRLENMAEVEEYLAARGVETVEQKGRSMNTSELIDVHYTDEAEAIVARKFAADFRLFGYSTKLAERKAFVEPQWRNDEPDLLMGWLADKHFPLEHLDEAPRAYAEITDDENTDRQIERIRAIYERDDNWERLETYAGMARRAEHKSLARAIRERTALIRNAHRDRIQNKDILMPLEPDTSAEKRGKRARREERKQARRLSRKALVIDPGRVPLFFWRRVLEKPRELSLAEHAWERIEQARATLETALAQGRAMYGVNTGFGKLAQTRIPPDELKTLQRNLVLSHAAGVGELLPDSVVRLVIALKVASLARGFSGVRRVLVEQLIDLFNADVLPEIPCQGSVGASGDLAPLAHLSAVLIGEGRARVKGESLSARDALARAGLKPLELEAKEGLALLNGTQVSTALALTALFAAEANLEAALVAGALSTDAVKGSDTPFDPRIHEARGQPGQIETARVLRALMEKSAIRASHRDCPRVQDPYSIRCQPQVLGPCLETLREVARTLEIEGNAATDNPLVFENGDSLSGGNFHAEPVALAADHLALAIAEIGALSERRIALLIDSALSDLPPFLASDSGVNSGFMIAHVTAASLASENKSLAHPASVDSLPTSANQEDFVSMATFAARRLIAMNANTANILGVELLAAAEGIEFRRPLKSSDALEEAHAMLRARVPRFERDRMMAPAIAAAADLVSSRAFERLLPDDFRLPSRE
jgi:histidine ammonia-lyase